MDIDVFFEIDAEKKVINSIYNIMQAIENVTPHWLMLELDKEERKLEITTDAIDFNDINCWFAIIQNVTCSSGIEHFSFSAKGIIKHDDYPYSVFMVDCNPVEIKEKRYIINNDVVIEESEDDRDEKEDIIIEEAYDALEKKKFEVINNRELRIVGQELEEATKAFTEHGYEFKIIDEIWNCYSPYFKGKKQDIEKILSDKRISGYKVVNLIDDNEIVSFKLMKGAKSNIDSGLILSILKDYPELVITCILTGDPEFGIVTVAVVFSESGCPYFTDGVIVGCDGTDDDYVMLGFEDLFEDYHYETTYEEPHSGEEIEIEVDYKYAFNDLWNTSFRDI